MSSHNDYLRLTFICLVICNETVDNHKKYLTLILSFGVDYSVSLL